MVENISEGLLKKTSALSEKQLLAWRLLNLSNSACSYPGALCMPPDVIRHWTISAAHKIPADTLSSGTPWK